MVNIKNIFISHLHEDNIGSKKLKKLTASAGLTVRDGSINANKPNNAKNHEYIMNHIITPRIK